MKIPLVGQSYSARSLTVAAQTCVNLIPEPTENAEERRTATPIGKSTGALYGDPGYHLFKDLTQIDAGFNPGRGIWTGGGRCFVAGGTKYCEIGSNGALIGSVRTISNTSVNGLSNAPVQFFPNGNELFIVAGAKAYVDSGAGPVEVTLGSFAGAVTTADFIVVWASGDKFDPSWAGTSITINGVSYTVQYVYNSELLGLTGTAGIQATPVAYSHAGSTMDAISGAFLDSYYVASRVASRQYNLSAVNDKTGSIWNGLDFGSKSSWPDHIRSVLVSDEQLYLFGDDSFEVHQNTGAASFPFQRIEGATSRVGSASIWGPISIHGRIFFLASNGQGGVFAVRLNGFTPVRVSTHAQESAWNTAGLGMNAISSQYTEEGHTFWVINFGTQTWVYDTTHDSWHQRKVWGGAAFSAFPLKYHAFIPEWGAAGKHLWMGGADGTVYESSINFYDDGGSDRKWERALPHLYNDNKRMYFGRMELEMETGTVASGAAPSVYLDYSDDRGHTWSTPEAASIGVHDAFTQRVYWDALGSSYDRVFRLSGAGQSKVALVDLELEMELGTC